MSKLIKLTTPLTTEMVKSLSAGDIVSISGAIYTARPAAYQRMLETLAHGEAPPFDVEGQLIYFVGAPHHPDPYSPLLLKRGLRGLLGKGKLSPELITALAIHKAVYFGAVEGTAALMAARVIASEAIAYHDLRAEAMRRLEVVKFPAVVINDTYGRDLYEEGKARYLQL
jgi:fumarate hydratase subunit beta